MNILKHESRFILQEPYKTFIDSIIKQVREQFTSMIPAGTILFRARINEINFKDRMKEQIPFPAENMGPPPHHLAKAGRINPEGIPYLYCAGDLDTAGAELRPWKGAHLTIGEVEINNDLPIADLTLDCNDETWDLFFEEFAESFSIQWPPELKLNYLITQYFSEHFKAVGLRGIKYKSEFNIGGENYSLFYEEDYEIVKTYSVETSEISCIFYRKDKNV
ncbi:MAG: hypothetical protein A2X55_02475 [Nitrospirae bacterium GWB2_47_37]|nr:MAG: hypothetical protein A2Z82_10810 [Nitrospirae bacterium GWA2_46_11]OGW22767.1 MAG: hypothetical protein A2X55_02475 [Nitrospirae bacterium GWB2_47_37]